MADFYVDINGNITSKNKKKKKNERQPDYRVNSSGKIVTVKKDDDDDIAPVRTTTKREEDDSKLDFFQKSMAFEDGWQAGDLTKTILSSAGDVGLELVKGVGGLVEGVTDLVGYGVGGVADLFGADDFAARMKKNAQENTIEKWTEGADNYLEQNSVFGRTSDAILQGIGQVGGIMATGGIVGAAAKAGALGSAAIGASSGLATAATTGLMGLSGMGSGMGEAYEGGATDREALTYGAISGAADALTELIFGGLGKAVKATGLSHGLSSADDMLAKKISGMFSNQIAKNFAEYGIKAGAEGFEEVLAGTAQAIGKKITYMKEEELSEILKDENLLEQFVVGAATSGMIQSGMIPGTSEGSLKESNKTGRDFITGLNQNEQAVIEKEVEKRIAAEEKGGKVLSKKERNAIYDEVVADMDKGGISIDTIEEVLGGETYTNYKKLADYEAAMQTEYDELGKKEHYTLADETRYKQLEERMKFVREKGAKNEMRKRLDDQMSELMKGSRLAESYNERARRGQKFEADLTQYDEKQKAIVQKAVESGILNNTRRTHEFVDMVAKIAADKGVSFDFTNNAKLKESGFAVDGKTVNGYVTKDGITVNIQSAKSLNSVVGHEITHVLEGTELYTELQKAVFAYAESKKDLAGRRGTLTALYQGVEGASIDAELTADLVGDYLFTDSDFINRLSTENRNLFQKIFDEVKYLLKVATAGSKEARQLEKVKRAFEKAYREGGKAQKNTAEDGGRKYSLTEYSEKQKENWSASKRIVIYDNPQQLSQFIQSSATGETLDKKMYFGAIPSDLAARIKADAGVDVENYNLSLGSYEIRKILKDHGNEAVESPRGQRAIVEDDFAHIVDVVLNPQKIAISENTYMGKPAIIFTGEHNGRMNVIAVVSDKRLDLFVQTIYVNTKKGNLATPTGEQAPVNTPEASSGTVSDTKLPQNGAEVKYSLVEDQGTIDFLENQEHLTVYKAMSLIDGKLYPPMASQTYVEEEYTTKKGEKKTRRVRKLKNPSVLGRWQQADERTDIAEKTYDPKKGYSSFDLLKSNGKTTGGVAYNPYEHTSNIVLNDQFSEAYQRPELVTVEYEIPVSELTSGYKAQYAKDAVGLTDWKAGGVAQKLKHGHRDVYLTRWSKPVRVLSDAEVAQKYKEILDKEEGISVPWNVVTPSLREELEKIGVPIDYSDIKAGSTVRSFEAAVRGDYEKPKKGAKYSLAADSEGRQIAPAVAKRFANSKVVDENGNLKVMYHGTPNGDFTVFRDGSYFTDNRAYAERFLSPSASSISSGKTATAPKVFEVYLDIKKPFDLSDAEARRIYIEEYIKGGNAMGINPYLSDAEYAKIETIDWTEGEDLRDFLIENGYDYDGLVLDEGADGGYGEDVQYRGKSYVVFSSEQVKAIDNANPTANPDIRFSLSAEVEPTDRLVAVHNKSVRGLQRMLDRGGVPFASIAIKKAGAPHEGFGEVSIVFPRSTIDPENSRWNRLYSNDAWTPTEPRTEYDVGDTYKYKKLFENMLGSDIYSALRGASYLDSDALERELGSSNGDVFEAVKRLGVVKYGYLQSIGQRPEMTTKQKTLDGFGRYKNDQLLAVFEALDGETIRNATYDSEDVLQQIADTLNEQFLQQLPNDDSVFKSFKKKPLYTADKINIVAIQDAYEAWEAAGRTIPTEMDTYALENAMRDNRELEEDEGYRRWVENIFEGLVKDSGIPNGRDYYTSSGNRRSFKQLHVPATLENIVQQMRKENETGIGSLGSINLRGAATKTYATVEEMRADSGKLLGTRIDDDVYDGYMDGFHARLNELKLKAAKGDSWSSRDTAEQVLLEAVRDAKTKASMASKLRKEAQWINYDPTLVDELWQLKQDVQNMPAPYFEAKPRRIITTDEAAAYIVPDDAPASLFSKLDELGLAYKTYKAGDEADRLAKLNSVLDEQPDLRFSLSAEDAEQRTFGNYNVYGRDIALEEDIAPVRQDIAPATVSKNATVAEVAPVQETAADAPAADVPAEDVVLPQGAAVYEEPEQAENPYAEIDRLTEQLEEMERQYEATFAADEYEKAETLLAAMVPAAVRITELEKQLDAEVQERLDSFDDADAPVEQAAPYSAPVYDAPLPKKMVQDIAREARKALGFSAKQVAEMRDLIEKLGKGEIDSEQLRDEIGFRFGEYTETSRDDDIAEVKKWLRTTALNVSEEVKRNFTDYGSSIFKPNFGKIRFSKDGLSLDMYYDELADKFPGFFPPDLYGGDQLTRIIEVANTDADLVETREVDGQTLEDATDDIVRRVTDYKREQRLKLSEQNSRDAFNSLMADADRYAPVMEEDIAPVRADVAPTAPAVETVADPAEEPAQESAGTLPIKTVKERLAAKLQNLQTELAKNQRLREESRTDYDLEILQAQTAYNALQNKNTKKANNILRRIERLRRISGNIDADYAKRISDLEAEVGKVSEEVRSGESATEQRAMRQELHARKIEEMRFEYAERGYDMDEVFRNAKDLSTLATVDNTPQRVMEKALGYKEGQILADLTVNKAAQNETEGIKWLQSFTDRKKGTLAQISKQYGIKPGSNESAAAQMYAEGFYVAENGDIIEYGDRELAKDFPSAVVQKNIKGLARDPRIRQIYDETLAKINESRARNGYPEIQRLENYFLHFRAMDDTFSRMGIPFNPNDIRAKDLPTDLNGVTADLKPGQPYFASAMHRKGKRTSFDLLGGLERYLTSAKGQIYHIDDIQALRALRNHIADTFGQAKGLENLDAMTEEEAAAQIEQVYDAHLSTFAKFLNEEANVIAGKTALIDRGLEGIIGRRGMTFFDTLNRQVGANMVGFNVSSALTNFIAPVQAFAKTNKAAFVKGFAQTVANRIGSITGKGDGFAESNPTMIRRQGADRFYRTPWQKAGDIGYALMGAVDSLSTEIIVRSKYNELVSKGMSHEQAVIEADKWTSRLMGDRSLGQQPQLYNSKMAGLVTKFQLEVRNQLDSQFYDTIQEAKVSAEDIQNKAARNAKVAAQVASTFVQLAVTQHLFGKAFEAVAGYNPAFDIIEAIIKAFGWDDEEESEDTVLDNLGQGLMSLAEDMPYSSVLTGTGRIPISAALPIGQFVKGEDKYGNEKSRLETLAETAPYYLLPGGYGQIKKTVQGLGMFDEDLPIAGSYTDSGNLRYPVEDTTLNRAQAAIFGQYASANARDYFDNERQALKKNQIQELVDVDIPIREYWDYREGLADQEELADKFDYIAGLDLPIDKKNILINNVVDRKEAVDLTNYDDFADYEEFDFAVKNPEKYDFLQSVGVSVAEYQSFDDDTKDAYNWAYENPEKYTVAKAVADDVAVYRQYTKALNDIKADKYADGRTVNGSRKAKVIDYINGLEADYYQKIILFKSEYNADDTYNREIIEYLNARTDISYKDMETILKELGFTVLPDGTVRW